MVDATIMVPRMADRDVVQTLYHIAEAIGAANVVINEYGAARSTTVNTGSDGVIDNYNDQNIVRIANANVTNLGFTVNFSRDPGEKSEAIFFDTIRVSHQRQQPELDPQSIRAVQDIVSPLMVKDEPHVAGLFKNPRLFRDLLASHHRQIGQLQQMALEVGEQATQARANLEVEYARRQAQLHEEMNRLAKKRDAEFEARKKEISEQAEELAARKKEVDDRDNTHVRRDLHKALKARIVERSGSLKVTPETARKRLPIHVVSWLAILALATSAIYQSIALADLAPTATTAQILILAAKPAALTLALLGLIAWYLRWMNRWFERYADAEFQLKQFELDIDRASWVVEAALEWKLEQDRPMPEHLLETISRNLFSKSEKDENADMHPADYLASAILGRASALNLKLPGGEISLTGRDIRKLQSEG